MLPLLDVVEMRVLGALIEKEATTPEYYPMSANALVNACNQKSNRHPVVSYDEATVLDAVERLREKKLAAVITGSGRVHKYAQRMSELLNLGRREMAVLCTLLLRGPQTLGEVRDRSERIYSFEDLEAVEHTLDRLAVHELGTFTMKLAKAPGQKEARYAQLLGGEPVEEEWTGPAISSVPAGGINERVNALEQEVGSLKDEMAQLRRMLEDFQRQFS